MMLFIYFALDLIFVEICIFVLQVLLCFGEGGFFGCFFERIHLRKLLFNFQEAAFFLTAMAQFVDQYRHHSET